MEIRDHGKKWLLVLEDVPTTEAEIRQIILHSKAPDSESNSEEFRAVSWPRIIVKMKMQIN